MAYEIIKVNIFETTAELWLDGFRMKETEPMYAAMIPGEDKYYCFTESLENLPGELARVAGPYNKVIPNNLGKEEYFRNVKFGDSEQAVAVYHKPLSPSKLEAFTSAAIASIGFLDAELHRKDSKTGSEQK